MTIQESTTTEDFPEFAPYYTCPCKPGEFMWTYRQPQTRLVYLAMGCTEHLLQYVHRLIDEGVYLDPVDTDFDEKFRATCANILAPAEKTLDEQTQS